MALLMGSAVQLPLRLPILFRDDHAEPSVFLPENLLREARRQRRLPAGRVPPLCLLDPDGDVVRYLKSHDRITRSPSWACYHSDLYETDLADRRLGIIGCAVGAPYAVLVAEQLFASGCELLISVTSAGQVAGDLPLPCFILIDRALRGEGTSHAYLPTADFADADPALIALALRGLNDANLPVLRGSTWTTDAPFRETEPALAIARDAGVLAVEMEAAALYAFGRARRRPVVCFAHVTNQLAQVDGDFEKGPAGGAEQALAVVAAAARGSFDRTPDAATALGLDRPAL
jgi:uridine phosphorylase